jgi:uncharacterized protein (DUF983 family)
MVLATSSSPSLWFHIRRGWRGGCPQCGQGKIFSRFLSVVDSCPACGEPLHHHRADDLPAYVVIMLIGHILVPMVCVVELAFSPPVWVSLSLWLPLTTGLVFALLQPVKGAIVAMQWHMGLHGFDAARKARTVIPD